VKRAREHALSVLVGVLGASLLLGVLGFGAPAAPVRSLVLVPAPVPAETFRLFSGTSFQVPEGKTLTLRAFEIAGSPVGVGIEVDGVVIFRATAGTGAIDPNVPFGVTAHPGEVVRLDTEPGAVVIGTGHLSDV
jgi:hypothetical protein